MIPYRIDPTLHPSPPSPRELGDGFEPMVPPHPLGQGDEPAHRPGTGDDTGPQDDPQPQPPSPARLPVEPEFDPRDEPAEPEDPPLRAPSLP